MAMASGQHRPISTPEMFSVLVTLWRKSVTCGTEHVCIYFHMFCMGSVVRILNPFMTRAAMSLCSWHSFGQKDFKATLSEF